MYAIRSYYALAGNRRDDTDADGLQRHRQVVREVRDLADLDPWCRQELVHRDDRTGMDLDDAAFRNNFV